jgi:CubicO group peptidase (beta-lactamase class C family)
MRYRRELAVRTPSQTEHPGISTERLALAHRFLDDAFASGGLAGGAALLVARNGVALPTRCFGRRRLASDAPPVDAETVFLVASVSKPVTVTAAMLLAERGHFLLDDPVSSIVPEFRTNGKENVRIRDLMTHTSGLPDMVPNNRALREAHAPFSEFVQAICEVGLLFEPGTNVSYQSCGTATLAEIVARVSGVSCAEFLRREFFEPLGMRNTRLGAQPDWCERVAEVNVPSDMRGSDWGWNSDYWRAFGAPWGGLLSTADDLFRFLQMFLNGGEYRGVRVLSSATVEAMTRNVTAAMPDLPERVRRTESWGHGWRIQTTLGWEFFGDLVTPGAFGHAGATGTVVWAEPTRGVVCVFLTTDPAAMGERILGRVSNLVAASII